MDDFVEFLILVLASMRIVRFLMMDEGPFGIFERMRFWAQSRTKRVTIDTLAGPVVKSYPSKWDELFSCHWCLGVWVAFFTCAIYAGLSWAGFGSTGWFIVLFLAVAEALGLFIDFIKEHSLS